MTNPIQVPKDGALPCRYAGDRSDALDSLKGRLRALGRETVTLLQTDAGPVMQTKVRVMAGDTASKLQEIAMKKNRFQVQLGRWRVVFIPAKVSSKFGFDD